MSSSAIPYNRVFVPLGNFKEVIFGSYFIQGCPRQHTSW